MNKQKINLIGGGFKHCKSTNAFFLPNKIEWLIDNHISDISIHVDEHIFYNIDTSKNNYGMISESKTIIPKVYEQTIKYKESLKKMYKYIFTHDLSLSINDPTFFKLITPPATSWIAEEDRKIYKKSKLISMIASTKNICDEHAYRLEVAEKYKNHLDLFGRGRNKYLENIIDGLKDYCFSIVIENNSQNNTITEKITNCFVVGTIPIYYGPKFAYEYFNPEGIIDIKDFNINDLTFELYNSKIAAIKENYDLSLSFPFPEDYAYENFIKNECL